MYNSFYGGRPTSPFVIARNYPSIDEMINDFRLGDNCSVKYGQYVLISTGAAGKNRKYTGNCDIPQIAREQTENGQLYRRGVDFTNSIGGAIYIGDISGPAGMGNNIVKEILYSSEVPDIDGAIRYLNSEYAEGYPKNGEKDYSAMIIFKANINSTNGDLFTFAEDAAGNVHWIYVGKLNNPDCFVNTKKNETEDLPHDLNILSDAADNASWFVVKSTTEWHSGE